MSFLLVGADWTSRWTSSGGMQEMHWTGPQNDSFYWNLPGFK